MDTQCVVFAVLAASGWMGFLVLLFVRHPIRSRAQHAPAQTAEKRARAQLKNMETARVQELADDLQRQGKAEGMKFSRKEYEGEARRILIEAGTGSMR